MEIKPYSRLKIQFDTSVTTLEYFFHNMGTIRKVDFSFFNSTEVNNMEFLFARCTGLETIIFGDDFNTSKVTNMMLLFYQCKSLTSIDLSTFDTKSVINMHSMFYGCVKLTEINLKTFKTGRVGSMTQMFKDCVKLTSLDLSGFDTSSLPKSEMFEMFLNCSSLVALDLSNLDLTRFTSNSQFDGLINLQYLNLQNSAFNNFYFSQTYLKSLNGLTICKDVGTKPFSDTTSKIFSCCETPFNTTKCDNNYILVEYNTNFKDNLIGFITRNPEINNFNKTHIYLNNNVIDYVSNITSMIIKTWIKNKNSIHQSSYKYVIIILKYDKD